MCFPLPSFLPCSFQTNPRYSLPSNPTTFYHSCISFYIERIPKFSLRFRENLQTGKTSLILITTNVIWNNQRILIKSTKNVHTQKYLPKIEICIETLSKTSNYLTKGNIHNSKRKECKINNRNIDNNIISNNGYKIDKNRYMILLSKSKVPTFQNIH